MSKNIMVTISPFIETKWRAKWKKKNLSSSGLLRILVDAEYKKACGGEEEVDLEEL